MSQSVVARAKEIYEAKKADLEERHWGQFVSIEPDSGDLFVAESFDAAVAKAIEKHPNRISHTIRVGHDAAFHIGLMTR